MTEYMHRIPKAEDGEGQSAPQPVDAVCEMLQACYLTFVKKVIREVAADLDDHHVDEIANRAILNAGKGYGSLRNRTKLATWLATITRNATLRYLEQITAIADKEIGMGFAELEWIIDKREASSPLDVTIAREMQREVRQAIQQLPRTHAAFCWCFYIDGMTYREIADRFGLPIEKIPRIRMQVLDLLRVLLRDYHE